MNKKYPNLPYDETQEKIYSRWKSMKRRCKIQRGNIMVEEELKFAKNG